MADRKSVEFVKEVITFTHGLTPDQSRILSGMLLNAIDNTREGIKEQLKHVAKLCSNQIMEAV